MQICIFTEPQQGASYDTQLAHAQRTEALGFDGWFRSDHYLVMGDGDGMPGPTDAWTTLAGLARETSRIRLGTLVSSATYRVPGILAIQVAQVDAMSGGRAELGLGTGWYAAEHAAYGIPFPEKRFGMLEEQLAIVTGAWATPAGATYSFEGEHYQLLDSPALPKPVQSPLPVIVGGGGARRTPQLAARYATEFNIGFVDPETVAAKFENVRAICVEEERDPATLRMSVAWPTIVGADEAEVRRRCAAAGIDPDSDHGGRLVGTPAQVVEKAAGLVALGAERLYLQTMDMTDLDHLDLIAAEVLPHLA
ncbi:LLM class F420-dependent oxidoreductase [Microcella daejeonensis]|uniref:LLM class F420-dependent oxidoreductase n=1 Tax=Microcella daejeonensis TaxID=2994971 RepID=A0A9E8MMX2_9MICO|nr:LLM class F420-dependent oxidoreductase [Microcella daejeonensis]WAB82443.1 LLM class F420-dependent oxidoreductase [Microcella daejeonensis]